MMNKSSVGHEVLAEALVANGVCLQIEAQGQCLKFPGSRLGFSSGSVGLDGVVCFLSLADSANALSL